MTPLRVNAMGMKCPWPALRAARALRETDAIVIDADDPIAGRELAALAQERCWDFQILGPFQFALSRPSDRTEAAVI